MIFYDDPEKPFINGQTVAIGEDGRIRHPKRGDQHCFRLNIWRKEGNEVHAVIAQPIAIFPYTGQKPIHVSVTYSKTGAPIFWIKLFGRHFRPDFMPKGVYSVSQWDIERAMQEAFATLKLMSETKWVSTPDNRPRHG